MGYMRLRYNAHTSRQDPRIAYTNDAPLVIGSLARLTDDKGRVLLRSLAMIYFVRSGQYIKIGVSVNPRGRIASIQSGIPEPIEVLGIVEGDAVLEAELHRRFASLRCYGEWFRDDAIIRQAIDGMNAFSLPQPHKRIAAPRFPATPKATPLAPDNWRFEVKRKPRKATRRNAGSTASDDWYYWVIRVHSDGRRVYYGTLEDIRAAPPAPQEEQATL